MKIKIFWIFFQGVIVYILVKYEVTKIKISDT